MSVQYDGAFPVGVSVGAVLLVGDERQIVTLAVMDRGATRPFFATRKLSTFEDQLLAISQKQDMHIDLSLNRDGADKIWRYDTNRREYLLKYQMYSDVCWPQTNQDSELNNRFTDADWIDDRNAVKAGVMPGFLIYSGKISDSAPNYNWYYLRKSALWLTNRRLTIRHTNRQGDRLDISWGEQSSIDCSGPLHRLKKHKHFKPQIEPA